jgi:quinone-modifying oxidoreductase, subunit QmoC
VSYKLDPQLAQELSSFGGETVNSCFNCGNCTAVCSLTGKEQAFPRRTIRYIQLGLRDQLEESPEAWLCYYCGDCSSTCPREAEPGELMMTVRRWLTSVYDWTGLAKRMYLSERWELGMLLLLGIVIALLFTLPGNFGFKLLAENPQALHSVDLEAFTPVHLVHYGDWALAGLLSLLLLINAGRMWFFVMRRTQAPLSVYLGKFYQLVLHGLTQRRWLQCDSSAVKHWLRHLLLVIGYGTMFLLVVVFLPVFQVAGTQWHYTSLFGYYSTLALLAVTTWMLTDRVRKREQINKHSHFSDWMFLILLFLTALTGILMHLCRLVNWPLATYIMYTVHLMVAVPMLIIHVPFSKWSHLLYRPLAMYMFEVKTAALRLRQPKPAGLKQALAPHLLSLPK